MERDWAFSSCRSSEASAGAARDPKPVSIFCLSGEALLPSARTKDPLKKSAAARIEAKEPLNKSAAARIEAKEPLNKSAAARIETKNPVNLRRQDFSLCPAGTEKTDFTEKRTCFRKCVFLVGEGGFEPPKAMLTDLQSAPFGHSGIPPYAVVLEPVDGLEPPTC